MTNNTICKLALVSASVGAIALSLADVANAQTATPNNNEDTIVVTGQRTLDFEADVAGRLGLSNRETPAIVDVVSQEDFQVQGVRTTIEAMNAAPGVNSGNLPGAVGGASMRGFTRGAVNYLYDGGRMASSGAEVRNWDSWSFERIEVLKGPSSVISGEGALAGAINFVPRQPRLGEQEGAFLASYGSQETGRLAGDLNMPLGEHAAMRADLAFSRSAGWVDDTDSETSAGRLALRFDPNERLTATLSADRFDDDFSTAYFGLPLVSAAVARNPSGIVSGSSGLVADEAVRDINYNVADGAMDSQSTWLRARAEYRYSDAWKLVSDASWYDSNRLWRNSEDYTFNAGTGLLDRLTTLITHDHQYWNERLHVAYDGNFGGHRNRFTLGVEVGGTDFATSRRFGATTSVDPFAPARGLFPTPDTPANFATRQEVSAKVDATAIFAEDAFNLTPQWLLVGGARLDQYELDRRIENVTTSVVTNYGNDFDPVSWRLGTVYSLQPQTQVFAQYNHAAAPVSSLLFMSATNATFDATTGDSYETGIKSTMFDGRAQITASAYHIRQDDILTRDPANPAVTVQGGSQISQGVEVSFSWAATEEVRVDLSAAVLQAEFDKLIETGGADRSGNLPANTPEQLYDLVVSYSPQAVPLIFTGIVRHDGAFFTSNANSVRVDGYTLFDAAVAWEAPFGVLTLRGRNLTDEFYADWSGFSATQIYVGEPRSFEVSLTRSF
ncbi:MAG: TonB-dependent receptor [Terricaulis sp.]